MMNLDKLASQVSRRLGEQVDLDVRLSARRKKTVSVRQEGETYVVLAPKAMSQDHLAELAVDMIERLRKRNGKARGAAAGDNEDLRKRAEFLNRRYLQSKASVGEVVWVTNMTTRWASCTPSTSKIRVSHRLQLVPEYVLDSVLIHELVHTFIPDHGKEFRSWEAKAPDLERAQGYLEAYRRWGFDRGN